LSSVCGIVTVHGDVELIRELLTGPPVVAERLGIDFSKETGDIRDGKCQQNQ